MGLTKSFQLTIYYFCNRVCCYGIIHKFRNRRMFFDSSKTASFVHLTGLAVGCTNHIISSNHPFIYAIRNAPDLFFLNSDLEEYFLLSSKTVSLVHFFCIAFIFCVVYKFSAKIHKILLENKQLRYYHYIFNLYYMRYAICMEFYYVSQ